MGMDTRRVENVKIPLVVLSLDEFNKYHTTGKSKELKDLLDQEFKLLTEYREEYTDILLNIEYTFNDKFLSGSILSPVNIERILNDIVYDFRNEDRKVDLKKSMNRINEYCNDFRYIYSNYNNKNFTNDVNICMSKNVLVLIRSYINSFNILKYKINDEMLTLIFDKITIMMQKSLIDYGNRCWCSCRTIIVTTYVTICDRLTPQVWG